MKALVSDKITRKTKTLFRSLSYLILFYSLFSIIAEQKIGLLPHQIFESIRGSDVLFTDPMLSGDVFFHVHIRAFLELFLFYFTSSMSILVFKSPLLNKTQTIWACLVTIELCCLIALIYFNQELLAYIKSICFLTSRLLLVVSSVGFLIKLIKNKGVV